MDEDVFVLGLDGMDVHLLGEAMEERDLPNFERFRAEGALGTLTSVHPPVTIPAWISMFTGKGPGELGAFHFQELDRDTGGFVRTDVERFLGTYAWDADVSAALVFVPGPSPPYEIDGVMLEGPPGPNDFRVYPRDLKDGLVDAEDIAMLENGGETFRETIWGKYEIRRRIAGEIYEERSQDLFAAVYRPADNIAHHNVTRADVLDTYERLDAELGRYMDRADEEDATLLLVSDHGTSQVSTLFYINTWLHEHGYLTPSAEGEAAEDDLLLSIANTLIGLGLKRPLDTLHSWLNRLTGVDLKPNEGAVAEQVDWDRSAAMAHLLGAPPATGIYLNAANADGETTDAIIAELEEEPEVEWVKRREEVYSGARVDELPDLVVRFADDVQVKPNLGPDVTVSMNNFGHGYDGIVGAYGEHAAEGEVSAEIPDIAPTLLHLLGRPVPSDMDGDVVHDLLDLDRDVETGEPVDRDVTTVEEELRDAEVKDRLEELGYVRD